MFSIEPYTPESQPEWDALVRGARNGVFLFERGYMDYHAQRFEDASLLVREGGALVAVLPAHRTGVRWISHGGLSFGGLLLDPALGAADVVALVEAVAAHLRSCGATSLTYRPVPHIYHRQPSEDDLYALHRLGARTVCMDVSATVDLARRPPLAKGRRHAIAKARRASVVVRSSTDYARYWTLLGDVLAERHGVAAPTHALQEIELLAARFPQIRLHAAYATDGQLLAGAVSYRYDGVLHTQYLAVSDAGRSVGALDAVIVELMDGAAADGCRWFSFGISTTNQGRRLNAGLAAQKEMFGGRSTVLQTLELTLGPVKGST